MPMFPYVPTPSLTLGPLTISAFSVLAGMAIVVGFRIAVRRARAVGLEPEAASSIVAWTIALGLVSAHLGDVIAYYPGKLRTDPLELFRVWGGMSSFGGIAGGLVGGYVVMKRRRLSGADMARLVDCVAFAFPFAWLFGRAGCALAHDHLGIRSASWLAVQFPDGARFDLGLLELLYTIPIAIAFALLARQPRPTGFYVGLFFVLYSPVRFALDVLRANDARYFGWTPGQFMSVATAIAGAVLVTAVWRRRAPPSDGELVPDPGES
jgi:phosphatidylglycerol:prolipoprotein diacylglycerol transferase